MSRRLIVMAAIPAALALVAGVAVASLTSGGRGLPTPSPTPSDVAGEPTPSLSPTPPPDPIESPPPEDPPEPPPPPEPTGPSYDVAAVQQRLADMRYYSGAVDGKEGPATRGAVMAFQKVNGLAADGVVGPLTLAALDAPVTPALRGGAPHRIEIDLDKQVLYFVDGDQLVRIMPVSSGSGATYRTKSGGTARSLTPVGTYHIQRRIRGVREADLGTLYDPLYFYKGWAIHGSNSVPAYPASHGCVRVPRWDAVWLFDRAPVGTQVVIYGGVHTFQAGSSAPGTDNPAGDVGVPQPEPTPTADPQPSAEPEPTGSPEPAEPSEPPESPAGHLPPLNPEPSPSPSAEPSPEPSAEPSDPPSDP